MTINRYRANNLKSAIEKATVEMGPDAKILHVRKLSDNNDPDINELIEIVAVVEDDLEAGDRTKTRPNNIDENKKSHSINMIIDDDFTSDDINSNLDSYTKNADQKNKNYSKTPKTLLEVIRTYSGKAYQNNNEKSNSVFDDSSRIIDKREEKDGTDKKDEQRKKDIYPKNPKALSAFIDNSGAKKNRDYEESSNTKQNIRLSKSRIPQLLHECLIRNHVDNDLIYEILSILNDGDSKIAYENSGIGVRECLSSYLSDHLTISKENNNAKKVIILIGPTGVGKTTTLAKLAAQYHFQKEKDVGLITTDAYRIAAIDQLKTYAQIMSIPLKVALTPEQLWKCIDDYDEKDVILVDTPGRSHLNMRELRSIEDFLEAAQPADTHLLISASTKDNDAYNVVEAFAPNYVQKYIFTKLDETSSFGLILNLCSKINKPISYFTIGQNVPEDIRQADIEFLADMFVTRKRFIR